GEDRQTRRIQARPATLSARRVRAAVNVDVAARSARSVPDVVTLERRLGPLDAAAIVVSNVIGGGIFFVPVIVAGLVPSGWAMLGVWLFGGVLAFAGSMAYAELAAL